MKKRGRSKSRAKSATKSMKEKRDAGSIDKMKKIMRNKLIKAMNANVQLKKEYAEIKELNQKYVNEFSHEH